VKHDTPHILLVNPWIHDFAAFDFWAKPLGLLYLAAILKKHGFDITYLDCLDRFHPQAPPTDPFARHGRGPYLKTRITKPEGLKDVPRNFSRYGIKPEWLRRDLVALTQPPDLVLVTSLMTYWYPGVRETIKMLKEVWPAVPVVLGGIYASLCREHAAKHSAADHIHTGPAEEYILKLVGDYTGFNVHPAFDPEDLDSYPYPAFELASKINYIPLLTSRGCPFACKYCASHFLSSKRMVRRPDLVVEEISYWHKQYGVKDFAFYDDALLVNAPLHAVPMLEGIIKAGLKVDFHTPNALHIREITRRTARLMYRAGFKTLRLGLETAAFETRKELDYKVTAAEFKRAVDRLKEAGFQKNQIGAYLLTGLPGQDLNVLEDSIKTVKQAGITPILAHYSPIPHTALWQEAVASSRYNLKADPVFTNNAISPCQDKNFSWQQLAHLKNLTSFHP
jgi:radical SAM superfamily enzyme YgiQ (UPF0313 family)